MTTTTTSTASILTTRKRTSIVFPGLVAAAIAAAANTLVAGSAKAVGVDFELPAGSESIPLAAFPMSTFVLSAVGVAGASALRRWTRRSATTFVRIALALTVISLAPPIFSGGNGATVLVLVIAHLAAATIMIPMLAAKLDDERESLAVTT
jgi:hypothetical protein